MNTTITYNAEYFINKLEKIPEDQWCEGCFEDKEGRHDVFGHLGVTSKSFDEIKTGEAKALKEMLGNVLTINDGSDIRYTQINAKQRILAALKDARDGVFIKKS